MTMIHEEVSQALARPHMAALAQQVAAQHGVRDATVLQALAATPRHACVTRYYRSGQVPVDLDAWNPDESMLRVLYADQALVTHHPAYDGCYALSPAPSQVAAVAEAAYITDQARLVHVGAGTGYASAIFAQCAASVHVDAIEFCADAAADGTEALARLRLGGAVDVRHGDGYLVGGRSYDRVIVTAGVTGISPLWLDHLGVDGYVLAPVFCGGAYPLMAIRRTERGQICGRIVAAGTEFQSAGRPLWQPRAGLTVPPPRRLPAPDHRINLPEVEPGTYPDLWVYLGVTLPELLTAVDMDGLDEPGQLARRRAALVLDHGETVVAIAPGTVAGYGPRISELHHLLAPKLDAWRSAGGIEATRWECTLELVGADAPLYVPAYWWLRDPDQRDAP